MDILPAGQVPVLATRGLLVLPNRSVPVNIKLSKSVAAIEKSLQNGSYIAVVSYIYDDKESQFSQKECYRVATFAKIERVRGSTEEGYQVILRGISRVKLKDFSGFGRYFSARLEEIKDVEDINEDTQKALTDSLKALGKEIVQLIPGDHHHLVDVIEQTTSLNDLVYLSLENVEIATSKKQDIFETNSVKSRALSLLEIMHSLRENLKLQSDIRDKMNTRLGKRQRETILREQLHAIREELGEGEGNKQDEDYFKRIADAQMPDAVQKTAVEEAKRLQSIGNGSPEAHVIRNYLDLLCALPWSEQSVENIELEKASQVLDSEHFGMQKVKKRILQHLAVMKLKNNAQGSIILLVGPPGVGKTSLGQSIAKALNRKFVRASLGGVRDESEIRGHRKTYIGAMPGRLIQGIKRAQVNNPVFLLDEIDKLGRGYVGDPASALLEVLDPEQNNTFVDHFLDVPFDLSNVFFIATANSIDTIPAPLLDRMEVIELGGYTLAEKVHIAERHLVPKQLTAHGLNSEQVVLGEGLLPYVIQSYTREAGVRDLQRKLAAMFRWATEKVVGSGTQSAVTINIQDVSEILGQERFQYETLQRITSPGVVTGLAWTPQGGDILFIESSVVPGSGKLILTGQLGDVMKESAQIALSLVKSRLAAHLPRFDYAKNDIHIHVPAGAIPKDGPSAGITMLTTIASLLLGRSVSSKLAMTGEVTLRGAVTPVGGIKEKLLAAHRAGIEKIILARRNERDVLAEVPSEVRDQLKIDYVESIDEVLKLAIGLDMSPNGDLPGPQQPQGQNLGVSEQF